MKFRIEHIMHKERPVFLFARQLEPGDFALSETPRLGNVPLRRYLAMPRTGPEVNTSVFAFYLASAEDQAKLSVGDVLELT